MGLSDKRLKAQIRDERKSSAWYRKKGFPQIAKDETRHRKILEKELASRGRRQ